jgi:AraC-like DNA-binding protein
MAIRPDDAGTPVSLPDPPEPRRPAPMDPLIDLLRALQLTGGVFLDAEFTSPWCVTSRVGPGEYEPFFPRPAHVIAYHYVVEGRCVVAAEGQAPTPLQAGEIVLLPRNEPHRLASAMDVRAVSAHALIRPGQDGGLARIVHGGGGERTRVLCGFLGTNEPDPAIAKLLPATLAIRVDQATTGHWIESSFRFAAQELVAGRPGSPTVLAKLAELLLIEAVRRHVDAMPAGGGWVAALRDPVVGRALVQIHSEASRRWTVPALARAAGASRSVFADRFTELLGEPPMRYLARHRLRVASDRLRDPDVTVAAAALDVGYASEAAFCRAFKREFGLPPAAWRRRAGA